MDQRDFRNIAGFMSASSFYCLTSVYTPPDESSLFLSRRAFRASRLESRDHPRRQVFTRAFLSAKSRPEFRQRIINGMDYHRERDSLMDGTIDLPTCGTRDFAK